MFCTKCGVALQDEDRFCSKCGQSTSPDLRAGAAATSSRRLSRPMWDKKIAGVCAGFARYFDVDVTLMRVIFLVAALSTGVGFVVYLVAWIVMPKEEAPVPSPTPAPAAEPQQS